MPSIDEVYAGSTISSDDLEQDKTGTIAGVEAKEFDSDEGGKIKKLVISFQKSGKVLICNKTNANRIAMLYGKDYSAWSGKRITLYREMVDFKGKTTWGVRVKPPGDSGAVSSGYAKPYKPVQNENPAPIDDDIPF